MTKAEAIERAKKNTATMDYLEAEEPEVYKVLKDADYKDRLYWVGCWVCDIEHPVVTSLATFRLKPDYQPPLSKHLPEIPEGIEVPDGCTYVGFGDEENRFLSSSKYIMARCYGAWFLDFPGGSPNEHYAVKNDAPAEIWARFGLEKPVFAEKRIPLEQSDYAGCTHIEWEDGEWTKYNVTKSHVACIAHSTMAETDNKRVMYDGRILPCYKTEGE